MAKGMMIVDGQRVNFDGEKNVLSVIRKAGIEMPTFCYYSDLSVYGACRMCVVEDEKTGKIDASCSMEPRDGMRISTNSARLLKHRRVILELLLASHNCNCTTCEKSGHCRLQELAQQVRCAQNSLPRYARALRDRQLVARGAARPEQVHPLRRLCARVRGDAGYGHFELCLSRQQFAGHARL